ncbi:MAG: 30S ribosomal protein S19 [Sulfolobales archaeon]|nr:30S ribosomal protein S19 [Sulfolobales archaeon]MCX8186380.1 30S ribosomal protein S19 [Sulfolobales archaeon]MDW7968885.1 30S ribosomal protein S19 [Sulfolobales archaeon]
MASTGIEIPPEWKSFKYRGRTLEELMSMSMDELIKLLPSRTRRSLLRESDSSVRARRVQAGYRESPRMKLLEKVMKARKLMSEGKSVVIKTHVRDMVVLPVMVGLTIAVYNGKEFTPVKVTPEMIGHFLGEFSPSCKKVEHGEPGLKATRSTLFVAMK